MWRGRLQSLVAVLPTANNIHLERRAEDGEVAKRDMDEVATAEGRCPRHGVSTVRAIVDLDP